MQHTLVPPRLLAEFALLFVCLGASAGINIFFFVLAQQLLLNYVNNVAPPCGDPASQKAINGPALDIAWAWLWVFGLLFIALTLLLNDPVVRVTGLLPIVGGTIALRSRRVIGAMRSWRSTGDVKVTVVIAQIVGAMRPSTKLRADWLAVWRSLQSTCAALMFDPCCVPHCGPYESPAPPCSGITNIYRRRKPQAIMR